MLFAHSNLLNRGIVDLARAVKHRWLSNLPSQVHLANLEGTRAVLRLSGPELVHFLQGLLTEDVRHLTSAQRQPLYSCILNAQGRFLHDIFLHPTQDAHTVLADVDQQGLPDVLRLLKRYRLHSQVTIDDISTEYTVCTAFGHDIAATSNTTTTSDATTTTQNPWQSDKTNPLTWPSDPRLPILGRRAILPREGVPGLHALQGVLEEYADGWRSWRVQHGVAEGDTEMPSGEAICLEYCVDGFASGISFDKGCYVGQELMARTHFKGVVRKRVMPVVLTGDSVQEAAVVGADVVPEGGGKAIGRLRVVAGGMGLAHLRLQPALDSAAGSRKLQLAHAPHVRVLPQRPSWWPSMWGKEDGQ